MTLNEAIKIKEIYYKGGEMPSASDYREADRLSIEALKRCKEARTKVYFTTRTLLPGETKDCCKFCGIAHTGLECPDRGGEK